mgnify:CR=1 FL=1
MNPTTFPDTIPVKEITSLVAYLRGQGGDVKTTAFDAWTVAGYALGVTLGQVTPAPHPLMSATKAEQADALENLVAEHTVSHRASAPMAVPSWLLPLALKILQDLLAAFAGG